MTYTVLTVVLLAAFLDAFQHFLIKSGTDPFARAMAVAIAGGLVAVPFLIVTGLPNAAAFPWLAGSIALGTLYWIALGLAYRTGTLVAVFPLFRGCGVLLTAVGAHFLVGERLSDSQTLILAVILFGLLLVSAGLQPKGNLTVTAIAPCAFLAAITACFTLVDATGVRVSGSVMPYCLGLYLGNAIGVGLFALATQRQRLARLQPDVMPGIFLSAAMSLAAYVLILFGFAHAPVALVAALAELSIVFAAVLGVLMLGEPARFAPTLGVLVVAAGVAALRLCV